MTGFLGYDPEGVWALRNAMSSVDEVLATIRITDAAAGAADLDVRRARQLLDAVWIPRLTDLLQCRAMTEPAPRLPTDDVRAAMLRDLPFGWTLVSDASTAAPAWISPDDAAALARLLSTTESARWFDTADERAWLTGRLAAIAASPASAAAFRSAVSADDVLSVLADLRLGGSAPDDPAAVEVDTVTDRLVVLLDPGAEGELQRWLDDRDIRLQPYAMAMVLASLDRVGLGLAGDELAAWCDRVLGRWHDPQQSSAWIDSLPGLDVPRTADLLAPLLVADPVAAAAFLRLGADHPEVIFESTDDGEALERLLCIGTDPAVVSADEAGAVIRPLLQWLHDHAVWLGDDTIGGDAHVTARLGGWLAPWLLQFGARHADWGWSFDEGDAALRWILHDGSALASLVAAMAAAQGTIGPLLDGDHEEEGEVRLTRIDELATMFAQLQRAVADEVVADAAFTRRWVDLLIDAGISLLSSLTKSTPIGTAAGLLLPPTVGVIDRQLTDSGFLPPDEALADSIAGAQLHRQIAATAVVMLVTIVDQLIAVGRLPAEALDDLDLADARPDEDGDVDLVRLHELMIDFADHLDDDTARSAVGVVAETFLSPGYAQHAR